jgi:hypothetical protein
VAAITRPSEIHDSLLTLIFSGVLERFPRLQVVSAENDIAWAPPLLERADKYHRRWKQAYEVSIALKPSDYFRRQIYFTFIDDPVGLATYQLAGCTDNIMWSTDYPHQAATWPHPQEAIARDFRGMPETDKQKIAGQRGEVVWVCLGVDAVVALQERARRTLARTPNRRDSHERTGRALAWRILRERFRAAAG